MPQSPLVITLDPTSPSHTSPPMDEGFDHEGSLHVPLSQI